MYLLWSRQSEMGKEMDSQMKPLYFVIKTERMTYAQFHPASQQRTEQYWANLIRYPSSSIKLSTWVNIPFQEICPGRVFSCTHTTAVFLLNWQPWTWMLLNNTNTYAYKQAHTWSLTHVFLAGTIVIKKLPLLCFVVLCCYLQLHNSLLAG